MDRTLPLMKGIIGALVSDSDVSAITTRVYSQVPQKAAFPYVKVSLSSEDAGTKDEDRQSFTVRVQSFARQNGSDSAVKIAMDLQAAVFSALSRKETSVTMDVGNLVLLQNEGGQDVFIENDGKTYQSVLNFNAITE